MKKKKQNEKMDQKEKSYDTPLKKNTPLYQSSHGSTKETMIYLTPAVVFSPS